ncbi:unnamed protein product [Lepeophtheirus salmonis]|uniref:(salmon louse) hypothetical protein n=1 Tax=Lepeophtheirus salmonis TaxID=72036 RepID=A0A7R8CHS9_LEPSM|nr:unnamed protein product [Lepeophtheirus salmonis]CAF2783662.1 unnamed protein product [Lepeophtheirus salmonis]
MKAKRWLRNNSGCLCVFLLGLFFVLTLFTKYSSKRGREGNISRFVELLEEEDAFPSEDKECRNFEIRHLKPGCIAPKALVSYPGSGNTWLRYLLDTSVGIFTGSRYKDLEIQSSGMWGEIRPWNDGSTLVQKTHDASHGHVLTDFKGGRGLLLIRNPYDAILSNRNYLIGGHVGSNYSNEAFNTTEWRGFISSQMAKWLNIATNWTIYSDPKNLTVVHLEDIKDNLKGSLEDILQRVFHIRPNQIRLKCVLKHRNGFFHRGASIMRGDKSLRIIPYRIEERVHMDEIIDYLNDILIRKGYHPLPLHRYNYYRQSDEEILAIEENEDTKGLEMVLNSYIRKLDKDGTRFNLDKEPLVSKYTLKIFKKALKFWPSIQNTFKSRDPILEENQKDGSGIRRLEDIPLPTMAFKSRDGTAGDLCSGNNFMASTSEMEGITLQSLPYVQLT